MVPLALRQGPPLPRVMPQEYGRSYALRSRTPAAIADVRAYFRDPGAIKDHSYVSARAVPDRATAIMLDAKGKDEFIDESRTATTGPAIVGCDLGKSL